jgi:hypothetical protein
VHFSLENRTAISFTNRLTGEHDMTTNNSSDYLMRRALYFPTITIPNSIWLRRAIFYWDEVGSIVPEGWGQGRFVVPGDVRIPQRFPDDLEMLEDMGVYRRFSPYDAIPPGSSPSETEDKLSEEFQERFNSSGFQQLLGPAKGSRLSKFAKKSRRYVIQDERPIHYDKLAHTNYRFLAEQGLAYVHPANENWYLFEENCALLHMSLLASYVAAAKLLTPSTDLDKYLGLAFQPAQPPDQSGPISCLTTKYDEILPIPDEQVSFEKILDFKEKHRDELIRLRTLLDAIPHALRKCESLAEANDVLAGYSGRIISGVTDLTKALNGRGIQTVFGTLKSLIKLDSPVLLAALAIAANQTTTITQLPLEWISGGLAINGAIQISTYWVDRRQERLQTLRDSPFAYLYYAAKSGIIKQP